MAYLVCQESEGEKLKTNGQEKFRKKHEDEFIEAGMKCEGLSLSC